MPTWVYFLIVVAALLAVGGVIDWRSRRVRRSLERYGRHAEPGDDVASIERTAPGTITQPYGHHGHDHFGGGPAG